MAYGRRIRSTTVRSPASSCASSSSAVKRLRNSEGPIHHLRRKAHGLQHMAPVPLGTGGTGRDADPMVLQDVDGILRGHTGDGGQEEMWALPGPPAAPHQGLPPAERRTGPGGPPPGPDPPGAWAGQRHRRPRSPPGRAWPRCRCDSLPPDRPPEEAVARGSPRRMYNAPAPLGPWTLWEETEMRSAPRGLGLEGQLQKPWTASV